MQPHTIFNMKMQCNVFLPQVLLTHRQFQRLKYSVCPSVCTDDLVFTRKNRLIIAIVVYTVELNVSEELIVLELIVLVRLSINTANLFISSKNHAPPIFYHKHFTSKI